MRLFAYIFLFVFVGQLYAQRSDFKEIDFNKADSIALSHKYETLTNIPQLSHKLTSQLHTDVEKFRAVYKWVCDNIENDYTQYAKNTRKRYRFKDDSLNLTNWNTQFRTSAFNKLLQENKATCTGYAYLVKELARYANLNCKIVNGYAKTGNTNIDKLVAPNHSWNAIELNGKWYLCDPTWASGIQNPESLQFVFQYNDGLFLTNPEIFAINHFPENKKWLLLESKAHTLNSFLEAPILYGDAYINFNAHSLPNKMHNTVKKNDAVVFKFQLQRPIEHEDIKFLMDNGNKMKTVIPKDITVTNEELTIIHRFNKTGFYDVHFFIGDDVISTYTFKVTKKTKSYKTY